MQIPVDIISGFLGAGKTTLLQKLLNECYKTQKIFLLENEFGQVGIDGALLADQNVKMKELYSGCICCSLKGDFTQVLLAALEQVKPQRIIIEPTGVGKLSEILAILRQDILKDKLTADNVITVIDAQKALMYLKNFGEFFKDQIRHAQTLILSKTKDSNWQEIQEVIQALKPFNTSAQWVTTPWDELTGSQILRTRTPITTYLTNHLPPIIKLPSLQNPGDYSTKTFPHHQHSHSCGCHPSGQSHQQNPPATDIFQSWSWENPKKFSPEAIQKIVTSLPEEKKYGQILRAKGIVPGENTWIHFEYVSGNWDIVAGTPQPTGRAVVIGINLQEEQLTQLFEAYFDESC